MFDEVTRQEGGKRAARRAGYVAGSTAFQVALVIALVSITAYKARAARDEPVVDVKFVRPAAPPPPPPPAPPAPPVARRRPPSDKPPANLPKPPPPQALLQPKEIQTEMKINPNEPKEPEYDYGATSGEGVVGGVVGAAQANQIEEAPAYATTGYVRPRMDTPSCVQNTVRWPPQLAGYVSLVTVKFAIRRDGAPDKFQVLSGDNGDPRVGQIVWRAVQECRWIPGTDPKGKPTSIWVILPLRFKQ